MSRLLTLVLATFPLLAFPRVVDAQSQFQATLAGHAWLPALAIALDPPRDAPES